MLADSVQRVVPASVAGTTPYPWPWNAVLTGTGTAVIAVSPSTCVGAGASATEAAVTTAVAVAGAVRSAGGTIIRVTTVPPRRGRAKPAEWFADLDADEETTSSGIDGFFGSALDSILRRRKLERLVFVGVGLETCVHSTMRSANDRGYECLLVLDACLAYDRDLIASSVSMIEMSGGIFGAVGTAAAVIDAFHPPEGKLR